jgi:hypothetical protein
MLRSQWAAYTRLLSCTHTSGGGRFAWADAESGMQTRYDPLPCGMCYWEILTHKTAASKRLAESTRAGIYCLRLYLLERQNLFSRKCRCVCSHSVGTLGHLKIHSHKSTSCAARWQIPLLDCILFGHVFNPFGLSVEGRTGSPIFPVLGIDQTSSEFTGENRARRKP